MRGDFILFLFCYMGYIWTLYRFCKKYLNDLKIDRRVFIILLFVMEAVFNLNGSVGTPYILRAMLSHMLFVGLFLIAFSDHAMKKFFAAMVLIAVKTLALNFGSSFFSCIVLACTNWITGGQVAYIEPWLEGVTGTAAYCLVILVQIVLRKKFTSVFNHKISSWYLMISVLLICIVTVVDIVNWGASNGIIVVSNANGAVYWNVYYNQIFSHIGICLLTILSMCIAGGFIFFMNKIYLEQRQTEKYYSQIEFYKMLNEQYLQMERLRHDMKNHVLVLHGLWTRKEFEKAGNYLEKMMESGNIGGCDEVTGNQAVDALLYNKKKQAETFCVRWVCDVQIPRDCTIDTFDLCVLFGNLLDNAIKACEEQEDKEYRFVDIRAQQVKKCFLLVMKNGTIVEDAKQVKQGIGFLNIYETVKKYDGTVKFKVENNVFEISILFPMNGDGYNVKQTV